MRRATISFRGAAALVGAILLALVSTGPAAAAHIPGLLVEPAFGCVSGPWADGTRVRFTLKSAGGVLKKQVITTAAGGEANACFGPPMVPGDRITVKVGSTSRTLSVPKLSLGKLDRVQDLITGAGPSGKEVRITVNRCPPSSSPGGDCPDKLVLKRVVQGGTFSVDVSHSLDLRGKDFVEVVARNASGDRFRVARSVPEFSVTLGHSFISGALPPGHTFHFELLDAPGGTVIATAAFQNGGGSQFIGESGEVFLGIGNQVRSTFASDAKLTVPKMIDTISVANDTVSGHCFAGQPYDVDVFGPLPGHRSGIAGPGGAFSRDMSTVGAVISSGTQVRLVCMSAAGDTVKHDAVAP